ncbi:hypothetical protein Tco_1336222 [Tanacetum coccineum]
MDSRTHGYSMVEKSMVDERYTRESVGFPTTNRGMIGTLMYLTQHISWRDIFLKPWQRRLNFFQQVGMRSFLRWRPETIGNEAEEEWIMSIIKEQQQALDDALVPREQRLRIGNCNYRLSTTFKPKEPTFQVVVDVLSLTPFYQAFLISASVPAIYMYEFRATFEDPPFEEDILAFIRELGYPGDIKSLSDVKVDTLYQPWRTFGTIINKCLSGKATRLDQLRLSRAQIIWEATRLHDFTTVKVIPKPKYVRRSTREKTDQAPITSTGKRLKAIAKSVSQIDARHSISLALTTVVQSSDEEDDNEVSISKDDDDDAENEDDDGFISNMLNPNPDTSIDSILNLNTESTSLVDVPVTTNVEMPPSSVITLHLPPIPLVQPQQQTPVPTPTIILKFKQTNQFTEADSSIPSIIDKSEDQADNEDFINKIDENLKKIIKEKVKVQVKEQVSKILPKIKKFINDQLEAKVLIRSSNKAKTSYAVEANLSKLELKKILIDKMENKKSIDKSI